MHTARFALTLFVLATTLPACRNVRIKSTNGDEPDVSRSENSSSKDGTPGDSTNGDLSAPSGNNDRRDGGDGHKTSTSHVSDVAQESCPPIVNAHLTKEITFDTADFSELGTWITHDQPTGGSWAHTIADFARRGEHSMKSEVRYKTGGLKYRAEIEEEPRLDYPGAERWYGISVYFPDGFKPGPGRFMFIQNHGKSPNAQEWELSVEKGMFHSILYSGPDEDKLIHDDFGDFVTGKWVDFVIHARYRKDSSGVYEVWLNGTKKIERSPPGGVGSTNVAKMRIQTGAYCPGWSGHSPGNASPIDVYHDQLKIAEGSNGYSLVSPGCNGMVDK